MHSICHHPVLQVDNNRLEALPHTISGCTSLRVLTAANNRLRALPERLGDCGRLQRVVFDVNPLLDATERVTAAVLAQVDATCKRHGGDLRAPGYVPVPHSDALALVVTAPSAAAATATPSATAAAGAASGSRAATASAAGSAAASRRASAVDDGARPGIVIPATPAAGTRPAAARSAAGVASAAGSAGGAAPLASSQRPP